MGRYAAETYINPEQTRGEIERLLTKYDASGFMYGWENDSAIIGFRCNEKTVKFILKMPPKEDFAQTKERGITRSLPRMLEAWEQAKRQRWRALKLSIQAKLEAVESGIATFEREFLPYIVLPGGRTVADEVLPRLGGSGPLLLGASSA